MDTAIKIESIPTTPNSAVPTPLIIPNIPDSLK
jgi:hypothetical protein